jgi:hypothetical protein
MVPDHVNSRAKWAIPALLSVLDRAARIVAHKFPGSVLELGELSRRDGGPISSHLSHQNGRDADIGFYLDDLDGQPLRAPKFIRCLGSGEGRDDPTVRFDDERNWAFVRAILQDPRYEVRQIFIYAPLRARLLAYAAKIGAPHDIRAKAAAAMMQPANALPHDDHFHIRISCPADQIELGCSDLPLWHSPGSPDEFGPELLAETPRALPAAEGNGYPLLGWGRISKLWSLERGVCDATDLTCTVHENGPVCEDLGELGLPGMPPPDEMGVPSDNVAKGGPLGPDLVASAQADGDLPTPPGSDSAPINAAVMSTPVDPMAMDSFLMVNDATHALASGRFEPPYCGAVFESAMASATMCSALGDSLVYQEPSGSLDNNSERRRQ